MIDKKVLEIFSKEPFIIAETAFSHEGSKDYLKQMIDSLSNQKNIALKFQLLINKDDFLTPLNSIYKTIDKWLLSEGEWNEVIDYAYINNTNIILAVLDNAALEIAKNKKDRILAIEIHPSCIPDDKFFVKVIEFCNTENIPLIIGISGFEILEIDYLFNRYFAKYDRNKLVFMYGFQNFPTSIDAIRLKRINLFTEKFNVKFGYADHTEHNSEVKENIITMVYGMGINILELHFVLEFGEKRTDYVTAYDANRIILIKNKLMSLYEALGECKEGMSDSEKEYAANFRKIPVYTDDFKEGHILERDSIRFKRSNMISDFLIFENDELVGKKLRKDVFKDHSISRDELG
ncbi:N-acetylneuraminate synthase family protein [Acetobacterium carbinolicum]|uniref:N-acetylneuraminate synthase family protein n=1 Tax=Acetobacterium carbinolicum TaxID=52690 RepID=UPI0039BF80D6